MWLAAPATILKEGQKSLDAGLGSQLQGVPVDEPLYIPKIIEGRWLQPGDGRVIVMNQETAEDENIRVGDMVTLDLGDLGEDVWQVVAYKSSCSSGWIQHRRHLCAARAVFSATRRPVKAIS
jgi:hypothetical protein